MGGRSSHLRSRILDAVGMKVVHIVPYGMCAGRQICVLSVFACYCDALAICTLWNCMRPAGLQDPA